MANKSVTITAFPDISKLVKDKVNETIEKNKQDAYNNLVRNIKSDTDKFVPYDTGDLSKSLEDTPKGYKYSSEYASYAFNPISKSGKTKNYTKTVHIQAQGNPVDVSEREYASKWAEQYSKDLLKGLGD